MELGRGLRITQALLVEPGELLENPAFVIKAVSKIPASLIPGTINVLTDRQS